MEMAAGAALLRSVATKMARPPPRLPYALEHHGRLPTSSGGLCLSSRFSTSTGGSMPPSANLRGPQPHNKEVPSGSQSYRAIVGFCEAAPIAAFFLFAGYIYVEFTVNPSLDRREADMDAKYQSWVTMREEIEKDNERICEEIKKSRERTCAMLLSNKGSQTEAAGVSEGHGMENL